MRTLFISLILGSACSTGGSSAPEVPESASSSAGGRLPLQLIRAEDIQAHVDYLASDELAGRHAESAEARIAAGYIAKRFEALGLEPLGSDGTYFQSIPDRELAPNVMAKRPGTGAGFVLYTAHYDHLKPSGDEQPGDDRIFNGADDNASGVAAVLEIAEAFARLEPAPVASIVFVAFTGEEMGLLGSRHFVTDPPIDLEAVLGVLNLDMVSRGEENLIFCEGGATAPALRSAAVRANTTIGLDLRFDRHPEWIGASDHYPFMQAGIPTLYFGVEDHPDYHRVTDHADRILAGLTERVARLAWLLGEDLARGDAARTEEVEGP